MDTTSSTNASDFIGSQGPVLTSSQRVMKHGKVVIRNSDDDDSDSDASLDDIDDMLAPRKPASESSPLTDSDSAYPPPSRESNRTDQGMKRRATRNTVAASALRVPPTLPVAPKYKFSLSSLAAQTKKDKATEVCASKARILLDSFEQQECGRERVLDGKEQVDENSNAALIASIMKGQSDGQSVERLVTAIQRTEALHRERYWAFFDKTSCVAHIKHAEFPSTQNLIWQGIDKDSTFREQAFLSGYAGDTLRKGDLPEEIILWIADAVCTESRDDLRYSYVALLKGAVNQLTLLLTPSRIDSLFQCLGARSEALNIESPIIPSVHASHDSHDYDWSALLSVLDLLESIAMHLGANARSHVICVLCRLVLDRSIISNCHVVIAVERAFASFVDSIREEDFELESLEVLTTVYASTADSQLRRQLLRYLPVSSPRLHLLCRRLALAFFFEDPSFLSKQPEDLIDWRFITRHLRTKRFDIYNGTDYIVLAASIGLLNVGLDGGDPPLLVPSDREREFNQDVDMLSNRIKFMYSQIVDTGASHMTRTEAKEVLEAFASRLMYAVRTKPKTKTMLFGNSNVHAGSDSTRKITLPNFLAGSKPKLGQGQ